MLSSFPKKIQSQFNGTLEISSLNGKKVLNSKTANYSYGALQRVLRYGLSQIYFDSKATVLLLGLGGGSVLETLKNVCKHSGPITAIEIDPVIIKIAQEEFGIQEDKNLSIIAEDALDFVSYCQDSFDLIIIDIFIDQNVPDDFYQVSFWDTLIRLLKPKGNMLFNAGIQLQDTTDIQSILHRYATRIAFQIHTNVYGANTLLIGRKK